MSKILELVEAFSYLSLLTVGGGLAAFPALEKITVNEHHWLTAKQLVHLYSVGQMAPGPNMMMVASIGEVVARLPGCLATVAAFFLPTALLTFAVGRIWAHLENWPWRASIQRGLAPVSVGLLLAGCISLSKVVITSWWNIALAAVVFIILSRSRINPALLILCGALIGLMAFTNGAK